MTIDSKQKKMGLLRKTRSKWVWIVYLVIWSYSFSVEAGRQLLRCAPVTFVQERVFPWEMLHSEEQLGPQSLNKKQIWNKHSLERYLLRPRKGMPISLFARWATRIPSEDSKVGMNQFLLSNDFYFLFGIIVLCTFWKRIPPSHIRPC